MKTVIFACIHNAGRSQMAAAFFNALADGKVAMAQSAGTQPGLAVHPEVTQVMKEVGLDLSRARPQLLTEQLVSGATLLVTMGCGEVLPALPGVSRADWPLLDPKGQSLDQVRNIRDDVQRRVAALVEARLWSR